MTLMHDRYLSDKPWGQPSNAETFHHYHGAGLFNSMLSQSPMPHEEKDAMWAAAALLGAITLASIDSTNAEACWPLAPSSPSDLSWLRMSDGKKEVWRLADPLREGSVWRPALQHQANDEPPYQAHPAEMESLVPCLIRLYNFDEAATGEGDPYHTATSIIIRLLPIRCSHSTILYFLSFLGHMDPAYRQLLHQKDPKAILLLAWWYATMLDYTSGWWLQRRALLECQAICVKLQRQFVPYTDIGRLLDFPKSKCGLAVSSEYARLAGQPESLHRE